MSQPTKSFIKSMGLLMAMLFISMCLDLFLHLSEQIIRLAYFISGMVYASYVDKQKATT